MTISGTKAKWLAAGIVVSLGLNLLLIGWIAGGRMHGPGFGFGWRHMGGGPMAMMAGMPDELWPMLKEKFKEHRDEFESHRAEMDQARIAIADTLAAEPFDAGAFDRALSGLEDVAGRMMGLAHHTVTEGASADLVVHSATTLVDILRNLPGRRLHVKNGRVVGGVDGSLWTAR